MADPKDTEVVKRIKQNEVELRDRNTVLRGVKPNVSSTILVAEINVDGVIEFLVYSNRIR